MENKKISVKSLVFTALAVALVTVCTMVIQIPVPSTGGFINFGDIMIFSVAIALGKRKGAVAGGVGSCLADILTGYAIFAPGTFIIKGIEGFLCGLIYEKLNKKVNNVVSVAISCIIAGAFMVCGYFIYESIIFSVESAIGSVIGNLIQAGVSAVVAIPISLALQKATKNIVVKNEVEENIA
ncbi:ECF transporter S component [Clostridium cylindrosporum]|uniref:Thiamine transporter HmpT n=1 Tax=Clostridium cylindrosporum DSM 605 TaxID=1121307 RepID=A0A0J8D592_CLOCY|nr:ECF transporter S component [Clostridium cylindrosporum]KMT20987.1 hypothetical protein CLCY_1c02210 [Clostridium cylindrosporum DSM 605]